MFDTLGAAMMHRTQRLALRVLGHAALFACVGLLCWQLRGWRRAGGDHQLMLGEWTFWLRTERWIYHNREPGAFLIHQAVAAVLPLWPPAEVYSVSAAFAGGLLACVLARISWHPAVWILVLANGTVFLFLGHAENYSLAYVISAATLLMAWRKAHDTEQLPLWPVVLSLCLGVAMHRAVVLFAAAVIPLVLERRGGRLRLVPHARGDVIACLLMLIALALFYVVPHLMMIHPTEYIYVVELDNDLRELITPLTWAQAERVAASSQLGAWFLFTLFSKEHFRHLLHFHLTLAPFGLLSLLVLGARLRGRPGAVLLTTVGVTQVWAFLWHPHGGFADWDLFSFMALPLNVTAGLLWAERIDRLRRRA